jgi:hypothetical protein
MNKFVQKDKPEYDYVDQAGKGWRLKKGETLDALKIRAKGGKVDGK